MTESCEKDQPNLVVHVETRPAPQQDVLATQTIHQDLQEEELLPATHIVDTAYMSGPLMVESQKTFGVELLGPVLPDTSWQAQADQGFDITHFHIDWTNQKVTCPEGQTNRYWRTGKDRHGHPVIRVYFPPKICNACPVVTKCTQSATGRSLSIKPQVEHEATQEARQRQELPEFKKNIMLGLV